MSVGGLRVGGVPDWKAFSQVFGVREEGSPFLKLETRNIPQSAPMLPAPVDTMEPQSVWELEMPMPILESDMPGGLPPPESRQRMCGCCASGEPDSVNNSSNCIIC